MLGNLPETTIHDSRLEVGTPLQVRPPNFYDDGQLFLVRCFACEPEHGRENYGLAVASGQCAYCGWPDRKTDKRKVTRQDRIDWLLAHQSLWEGWPTGNAPLKVPARKWIGIVEAMRAEGLVSPKTNWKDVNLTNLISDARKQRRMSYAGK